MNDNSLNCWKAFNKDNQQPESAGMPSNGSETHSTSRTEVVWDAKIVLEKNFVGRGIIYPHLQRSIRITWRVSYNKCTKPHMGCT